MKNNKPEIFKLIEVMPGVWELKLGKTTTSSMIFKNKEEAIRWANSVCSSWNHFRLEVSCLEK